MGKYLKMADVFVGEYKSATRRDSVPAHRYGEPSVELYGIPANYASHAINSHDDLVAEVDRLRGVIESVISTSEALALKTPTSDWGDGFKECALATANALKNIIDSQHK